MPASLTNAHTVLTVVPPSVQKVIEVLVLLITPRVLTVVISLLMESSVLSVEQPLTVLPSPPRTVGLTVPLVNDPVPVTVPLHLVIKLVEAILCIQHNPMPLTFT